MTSVSANGKSPGAMPVRKRYNNLEAVDVLVFLIPCLQLIRIKLIGVLNGSDLILLVFFLYLVFRGKLRIATAAGKWTLALCSLWLASQCVTDMVRHSAFADYARTWSNIGMTFVGLAVLWTLLYGRPQRLVFFGWGFVVGSVLYFFINPNEAMSGGAPGDAWKFGLAYPITLGVFLFASRKECRGHWPVTLAVAIGIINLWLGSRNAGGECLAAALYLGATDFLRRKHPGSSELKAKTVATLAASILLGIAGVVWAYQYAATRGILGDAAKDKYEQESSGKYGVLLGGRTEILAEFPAIYDSPILGHGSWAKDPIYTIIQNQALARLGYTAANNLPAIKEQLYKGFIPTHSYLFGAWVDGGILGAIFWGWVLVLTARALLRVYPATVLLLPAVSFMAFLLLWNVLFSPYGTDGRLSFPYSIVMVMTCMDMARRNAALTAVTPARQVRRRKLDKTA